MVEIRGEVVSDSRVVVHTINYTVPDNIVGWLVNEVPEGEGVLVFNPISGEFHFETGSKVDMSLRVEDLYRNIQSGVSLDLDEVHNTLSEYLSLDGDSFLSEEKMKAIYDYIDDQNELKEE